MALTEDEKLEIDILEAEIEKQKLEIEVLKLKKEDLEKKIQNSTEANQFIHQKLTCATETQNLLTELVFYIEQRIKSNPNPLPDDNSNDFQALQNDLQEQLRKLNVISEACKNKKE